MKKIVVVEDCNVTLNVFMTHLEKNGFDVDGFVDPLEAKNFINKNKVDLVITDYKMGKLNGNDLVNLCTEYSGKFLLVTGSLNEVKDLTVFCGFLEKPFYLWQYLKAINKALEV